jgi:hypothetical protein
LPDQPVSTAPAVPLGLLATATLAEWPNGFFPSGVPDVPASVCGGASTGWMPPSPNTPAAKSNRGRDTDSLPRVTMSPASKDDPRTSLSSMTAEASPGVAVGTAKA